ncbi:MAG: hypothetical protein ACRETL_08820, partial [Gammaproteobacteria bacterium]
MIIPSTDFRQLRVDDSADNQVTADNKVLRFGIPKGSLEAQTLELMRKSGWRVNVGDRSYIPRIDDPSLSCRLLRQQ